MIPKEKAMDLYNKFFATTPFNVNSKHDEITRKRPAKMPAKMCVDEIISACNDVYYSDMVHFKETGDCQFWLDVKAEIEKL